MRKGVILYGIRSPLVVRRSLLRFRRARASLRVLKSQGEGRRMNLYYREQSIVVQYGRHGWKCVVVVNKVGLEDYRYCEEW